MSNTRDKTIEQVRERMRKERLSQRQLAARLGLSQGHVSKVLSGKIRHDTRAFTFLASWAASPQSAIEDRLLEAARRAAGGRRRGMEILMHLMHVITELQAAPANRRPRPAEHRRAKDASS